MVGDDNIAAIEYCSRISYARTTYMVKTSNIMAIRDDFSSVSDLVFISQINICILAECKNEHI
jgi:hypothetical protein